MRNRLRSGWLDWRDSLGFLPTVCTIVAVALALAMVRLDQAVGIALNTSHTWVFGGGAEGARSVLQAIAGSFITVAGTVFSLTIVALQLASGQFTPRVLRTFTGDRAVQFVLGIFIGTFTYCLLLLRSVRLESQGQPEFVPALSVTVAVVLALASIGALVFYIHRIANSIQVSTVLARVTADTRAAIDRNRAALPDDVASLRTRADAIQIGEGAPIRAERSGYLRFVSDFRLKNGDGRTVVVQVTPRIGAFVLASTVLARVWPGDALDEGMTNLVRGAVIIGTERSIQYDVDYGIRQVADIGVRALSPGINDPTTAAQCVDRLCELLADAARSLPPDSERVAARGNAVLVLPEQSFDRLIRTGFAQVIHYGSEDATFLEHTAVSLERLSAVVPPRHRMTIDRVAGCVREQLDDVSQRWPQEGSQADSGHDAEQSGGSPSP